MLRAKGINVVGQEHPDAKSRSGAEIREGKHIEA
jgi:hypothetical protein